MKKKLWVIFLAVACCIACALGVAACNTEKQVFTYELSADGSYYSITEIKLSENCDLQIPSEYEGKPVKRIEEYAADRLYFDESSKIQTLTIPSSINYIGERAFGGVRSVKFGDYKDAELTTHDNGIQPYSVYIGKQAFIDYLGTSAELPENVYLGERAFLRGQLKSVSFKGKIAVKTDGSYSLDAFDETKLESIELPEATAAYSAHLSSFVDGAASVTVNMTYRLPLKYVVVPDCVKLGDSWVGRQLVGGSDVMPPKLYLKIAQDNFTCVLANNLPAKSKKVQQTGCSQMSFGQFLYYYSEERPSAGNEDGFWHYVDGTPTEW